MTLVRKYSKYNVPQQFVEMLLLQNKPWQVRYKKNKSYVFFARAWYRMEWKTIFPYSIRAIFFHSILKFSSIFHSILPYQGMFKPEATRNLHCIFATLSVLLQVVAREGKQYGTLHLIPYLKDYLNELP